MRAFATVIWAKGPKQQMMKRTMMTLMATAALIAAMAMAPTSTALATDTGKRMGLSAGKDLTPTSTMLQTTKSTGQQLGQTIATTSTAKEGPGKTTVIADTVGGLYTAPSVPDTQKLTTTAKAGTAVVAGTQTQ